MTTAAPLTNNTQLSANVTTKPQEQSLYQSSGAIVAAIVVGVIIIFTAVLLILKTYNRKTERSGHILYDGNGLVKAYKPSAMQRAFFQSFGYGKTN